MSVVMTNLIWGGAIDRGVSALERKAEEQERSGRGGIWPVFRDLNTSAGAGLMTFCVSTLIFIGLGMASFAVPVAGVVGAGVTAATFLSGKSGARLFGRGRSADLSEPAGADRAARTSIRQPAAPQHAIAPKVTTAFTQQAQVISELTRATENYTGDLKTSANRLTTSLDALLKAVTEQGEIPHGVKTLFGDVVGGQVLSMTRQFRDAGGQSRSPAGAETLKAAFDNVTAAVNSQLNEIGETHQNDLEASAEVIKRQLKGLSLT